MQPAWPHEDVAGRFEILHPERYPGEDLASRPWAASRVRPYIGVPLLEMANEAVQVDGLLPRHHGCIVVRRAFLICAEEQERLARAVTVG